MAVVSEKKSTKKVAAKAQLNARGALPLVQESCWMLTLNLLRLLSVFDFTSPQIQTLLHLRIKLSCLSIYTFFFFFFLEFVYIVPKSGNKLQ